MISIPTQWLLSNKYYLLSLCGNIEMRRSDISDHTLWVLCPDWVCVPQTATGSLYGSLVWSPPGLPARHAHTLISSIVGCLSLSYHHQETYRQTLHYSAHLLVFLQYSTLRKMYLLVFKQVWQEGFHWALRAIWGYEMIPKSSSLPRHTICHYLISCLTMSNHHTFCTHQ